MSAIYDIFISALENENVKLLSFDNIKNINDYIKTVKSNVLTNMVESFRASKPETILCRIDRKNVISFESDTEVDFKCYIIMLNASYYFVTDCFYNDRVNLVLHCNVDTKEEEINVYVYTCVSDKLHQYSSILYIERNLSTYKTILNSIVSVDEYTDGIYEYRYLNNSDNLKINVDQLKAIKSLSKNLEVIHGPPGTGKSTTIMNMISMKIPSNHKILCTAVQNQAIETLAEKMIDCQMNFTVVGNDSRLKTQSRKKSLLAEFDSDEEIIKLKNKIKKAYEKDNHEKIIVYQKNILMRQQFIASKYKIFVSTIASAHKVYSQIGNIDTVIVDEGGYTTEMDLIPLIRLNPKNLILIGDHKQLRPFGPALEKSNQVSLLERSIKNGGKFFTLNIQYRMNKIICALVSSLFYENKLVCYANTECDKRSIIHHEIKGIEMTEGSSFFNKDEVNVVINLCKKYQNNEILILTFYNAQLEKIKSAIVEEKISNKKLNIRSIDSAQGMEAEIVIISLVRTKYSNFLCDQNRLCVMLSRAKDYMIFVGSIKELAKKSIIWNKIDAYIKKNEF